MTTLTGLSALVASCVAAATLSASPALAAQPAAVVLLATVSAADASDEDLTMPDDVASADQTPEASNPDAPAPVLADEPSDATAPEAVPATEPPSD